MSSDNFCILVLVAIIVFMLYMMNKSGLEGFEDTKTLSAAEVVKNIVEAKNGAAISQDLVDKMATKLVETAGRNTSSIPAASMTDTKTAPIDIFKDEQPDHVGLPGPNSKASNGAKPFDNNLDNIQLSSLARDTKNLLTSDQLLPNDTEANEHNAYKINASYMDTNLLANGMEKMGVDTVGSSRRVASWDIRGNIPCPKMQVSPFLNSSYDPDNNLVGLNKTH